MRQVVDLLVTGGGAPGALEYLSAAEQRELDNALNALSSPDAALGVPAVQKLASDALQESKARTASARARLQFAETHCEFEAVLLVHSPDIHALERLPPRSGCPCRAGE